MTIRDIAEHFNISVSMVSRAVNNSGYVRRELREAVQAYARTHHWQPSRAAAALKNRRTGTVGVVMSGLYFNQTCFLRMLLTKLRPIRYSGQISLDGDEAGLDRLIAAPVESLLICNAGPHQAGAIERAQARGIPVLNIFGHAQSFPSAWSNHRAALSECVARLAAAGHRRIGYVGPDMFFGKVSGREQAFLVEARAGFVAGLAAAGVAWSPEEDAVLVEEPGTYRFSGTELDRFFSARRHTAVIAWTCQAEIAVYASCRRTGIRIPEDLAVIGFEGDDFLAGFNPPPAHYLHNYERFVEIAAGFVQSRGEEYNGQYCVDFVYCDGASIGAGPGKAAQEGKKC